MHTRMFNYIKYRLSLPVNLSAPSYLHFIMSLTCQLPWHVLSEGTVITSPSLGTCCLAV